jgi:hypothetical protein
VRLRGRRCGTERGADALHILIAVVRKGRLHPPGSLARAITYGAKPLSDDDILEEARAAFQLAADAEAENRRDALDDLRFARLGEQWPEKVRRERELEGRPCLTINRLPLGLFAGQNEQGTKADSGTSKTKGFEIGGGYSEGKA